MRCLDNLFSKSHSCPFSNVDGVPNLDKKSRQKWLAIILAVAFSGVCSGIFAEVIVSNSIY